MIVSREIHPAAGAAETAASRERGVPARTPAAGTPAAGTPWTLRLSRGSGNRPALEVYEAGALLDIVVPTPLAPGVLRGARQSVCGARPRSLAWGRLPAVGGAVTVTFSRGRVRRTAAIARVSEIGGWFWVATADGLFDRVSVSCGGASPGGRA